MLLFQLHSLALRLLFLRRWCLAAALLGVLLTGFALLQTSDDPPLLLRLALVLTLWGLLVFTFLSLFRFPPPLLLPHDSLWERVRTRLRLAGYHLLAAMVTFTGLTLLSMSLKLIASP